MKNEDFDMLLSSITEAGEIKKGHKQPKRLFTMDVPEVAIIRKNLGISQTEFALMIGVSVRTLQNWEQGRRKPKGPAKALLHIAAKKPGAVLEALHS